MNAQNNKVDNPVSVMLDDTEFRGLLKRLNRPWDGYRKVRKGVIKRLRRHMQELGCSTVDQYIAQFKEGRPAVYHPYPPVDTHPLAAA